MMSLYVLFQARLIRLEVKRSSPVRALARMSAQFAPKFISLPSATRSLALA